MVVVILRSPHTYDRPRTWGACLPRETHKSSGRRRPGHQTVDESAWGEMVMERPKAHPVDGAAAFIPEALGKI